MTPSQSTDDLVKCSKFPTNGDAEKLRKKGRWFGIKGMEKTAQDFFDAADTIERLQADLAARDKTIETLREKIREAYEVYAGSEGFIPETAPEGYQQRIIGQITEILAGALAARSEVKP